MKHDLLYAFRLMRMNPAFYIVAALSLALGVGANTAIFQLLDAVSLKMLPVDHPEHLVELTIAKNEHCCSGNFTARRSSFTGPQWEQIRDRQQAFSGIMAWGDHRFNLADSGEVRYAEGLWVSGDYFRTLGVNALLGRTITLEDDRVGCAAPGVVISYPFWQREYAGNAQTIGQKIPLDGHPFPIIGIAPAGFYGVEVGRGFDVAVPLCAEPVIAGVESHTGKRNHWWLASIGRLKPGWSVPRADAQLKAISKAVFENTVPPNRRPDEIKYWVDYKLTVDPAGSGISGLRRTYQTPLMLLLGIAGLVLLIACANLANLMLARASTREREMAVRLAIGAGRGRLVRQLLAESLLIAVTGAAFGAFLARFLSEYMINLLSTGDDRLF